MCLRDRNSGVTQRQKINAVEHAGRPTFKEAEFPDNLLVGESISNQLEDGSGIA
jgi:hypothetical protein